MKRVRNTNHTTSHLKILLMWAFVPVLFIALAIVSVKWYVGNIESSTDSFPTNDDIEWGKVISNTPDIKFEITDSLKYYRYDQRESLKRSYVRVANVSKLFPDFNSTLLMLESQHPMFDFSKGGTSHMLEVRQQNGGVYYGRINRNKDGKFYLTIAQDSIADKFYIPLGRFTGSLNIPNTNTIDVAGTTLNVVAIVALMLCLIGFGIMLSTERSKRSDDTEYLFVIVYVTTCILLVYVGFWLFDGPAFFGKRYDYPEWIAVAWLLSEIGLLGGILCKMKVDDKPSITPQKTENVQKGIK